MRRIPIVQGEHRVVTEPNVMITTVLGSCVAVCLQDNVARVGGMNHFLLAEPTPGNVTALCDMQRYGIHAMELLINEMMRHGASRERLRAHLYGGANIVKGLGDIGGSNAAFARAFIRTEGIAVGHCDLGGRHARKVEFLPYEGKARSAIVHDVPPPPVVARSSERRVPAGDIELF
jgi:chemotaxis protein CheD